MIDRLTAMLARKGSSSEVAILGDYAINSSSAFGSLSHRLFNTALDDVQRPLRAVGAATASLNSLLLILKA